MLECQPGRQLQTFDGRREASAPSMESAGQPILVLALPTTAAILFGFQRLVKAPLILGVQLS